jgi:hypothetical protein
MKSAFLVLILLGLLVAGWLMMKDVSSRRTEGTTSIQAIDKTLKAREAAEQANRNQEKALDRAAGDR